MAPSPITPKVGSPRVPRNVNDTDYSTSQPGDVEHNVADYAASPGQETSPNDLPFRTVEWGRDNGDTPSTRPRLASPFEEARRRTSIHASRPTYTRTSPQSTSPRFMSPTTPIPSYIRSPSTPTRVKCRSASFAGTATPSTKIKEEEDEDNDLPNSSTPPLTGRRGSAPSEGQSRHASRDYKLWRKKRKEQKMRLRVDAVQYEAEQAALFSAAHRQRQNPPAPVAENGDIFIKKEHRDGE
ncbi:MAG: hypothetical protein Q9178_007899 [Gyalolechia marmorata]